jgi:hypothetical protein
MRRVLRARGSVSLAEGPPDDARSVVDRRRGSEVEVLYERVAGLDIGKATLTVCAHARATGWPAVGDADVLRPAAARPRRSCLPRAVDVAGQALTRPLEWPRRTRSSLACTLASDSRASRSRREADPAEPNPTPQHPAMSCQHAMSSDPAITIGEGDQQYALPTQRGRVADSDVTGTALRDTHSSGTFFGDPTLACRIVEAKADTRSIDGATYAYPTRRRPGRH